MFSGTRIFAPNILSASSGVVTLVTLAPTFCSGLVRYLFAPTSFSFLVVVLGTVQVVLEAVTNQKVKETNAYFESYQQL